ncbi:MAG: NADH-quinone oxidoreductase subunit L [Bacteroidota bacterium]|nr:NADH-quinone oxidoreductase subunit L [Odoribacter sp.]MDP3644781.1 NADH-quinone oxidoreductase subunit L [Bacteroidota bacterium]
MTGYTYTVFILIIPLVIFLITGLMGMKWKPIVSGVIGTAGMGISFVLSLLAAASYFFGGTHGAEGFQTIIPFEITWLRLTESLIIKMGILLDPISVMMLVVVTTVSFMVHLYSLGYMKGEGGFARFYSFLSLFTFSMLGLVIATNIFQMYIFWELVGVSSYLLIGFYYQKPSAVAASKKAFIVTRFADLGFLIGILILSFVTGTFDFGKLTSPDGAIFAGAASLSFMGISALTWAMTLIFIGGAGKSAMFPLHIWLPDAMEGPTPVSALIHAATMVVAGIFLVARMFPVIHFQAPAAQEIIAFVGGFTSLFAAVIAITQYDIKRVLAFSTLSQLGYMMLALGVSGYGGEDGLGYMASMFHLFTHAMFKALLFLGAGSIIHAVHSNYMYDMGGLRKYLPITHITFLIACLTIAGIPPFSGFFSKDEILVAALHHNKFLFAVEYLVAGLTAFYMFRLYFNVFWGKDRHYHHTPHESPMTMTIPLMFLAVASIFSGFIPFHHLVTSDKMGFDTEMHLVVAVPSVLIGLLGIALAWILYKKESAIPEKLALRWGILYTATYNKFYFDEIYLFVARNIIFKYISRPVAWFDRHIVDGFMVGIAVVTEKISFQIKGMQSGQLQHYAFIFVAGTLALALSMLYFLM